jgi:hypothetical protein
VAVAVVVGLEAVEVEQHERVRSAVLEREPEVGLELAPVAQSGERVSGGLDAAGAEQRLVLLQREHHAAEHECEGRHRQADRHAVDVQRDGDSEQAQRDHAERHRDEQAARAAGAQASAGARPDDHRGRHPGRAGGDERVGDVADLVATAEHVDEVGRLPGEDRAAEQQPDAIDLPAGERDGADDRAQQHEVRGRIGEVGQLLRERCARRAVDRRRHGEAGQQRGDGEAADDAVQARRHERVPDPLAGQRQDREVLARIESQPERIRDRRHRDRVEVGGQRVDRVPDGDHEQPRARRAGRESPARRGRRVGHAGEARDHEDGVVDPAREEVRHARIAERQQGMGPDRHQQRGANDGREPTTKPDQHRLSDRREGRLL